MKQQLLKPLVINYRSGFNYEAELCRVKHTIPHLHQYDIEIVYCLEGELTLVAGDTVTDLCSGGFFVIDFDESHFMKSENEALVLLFHIDLRRTFMDWDKLKLRMFLCNPAHCFSYQRAPMNALVDLTLALSAAHFSNEISAYKAEKPVDNIIEILTDYFDWFNYDNPDGYVNPELRERFYRSLEYCINNYTKKISASDLAVREHINPNYFSQFLATTVFNSFSYMVKYVRCFYAEHLLLQTDMPNYEIAYSVGFSDPKYFYPAFEYWWHRSPKEHRRLYQNQFSLCEKEPSGVNIISGRAAAATVEKYISRWHLIKVFEKSGALYQK